MKKELKEILEHKNVKSGDEKGQKQFDKVLEGRQSENSGKKNKKRIN